MSQKFSIDQPIEIIKTGSADGSSQSQQQPAKKNVLAGQFIDGYPLRRLSKKKILLNFYDVNWRKPNDHEDAVFAELSGAGLHKFQLVWDPANPLDIDGNPGPLTQEQVTALQNAVFALPQDQWKALTKNLSKLLEEFKDDYLETGFFPVDTVVFHAGGFSRLTDSLDPENEDKSWTKDGLELPENLLQNVSIMPRISGFTENVYSAGYESQINLTGLCTRLLNPDAAREQFVIDKACDVFIMPRIVNSQLNAGQSHDTVSSPPPASAFFHGVQTAFLFAPTFRENLYKRDSPIFKTKQQYAEFSYSDIETVQKVVKQQDLLIYKKPDLPALKTDSSVTGTYPFTSYVNTFTTGTVALIRSIPQPVLADFNYYTMRAFIGRASLRDEINPLIAAVKKGEEWFYFWRFDPAPEPPPDTGGGDGGSGGGDTGGGSSGGSGGGSGGTT